MSTAGRRLVFSPRPAQARDEDDVRATLAELEDRYGPLPDEAQLLGEVMIDKTLVRALGALGYLQRTDQQPMIESAVRLLEELRAREAVAAKLVDETRAQLAAAPFFVATTMTATVNRPCAPRPEARAAGDTARGCRRWRGR